MKYLCSIVIISTFLVTSCKKQETIPDINVQGYWQVQDPTYTLNSTRDRFHLFKGANVYYMYSFLKTHNYTDLTSKPQSDSVVSFYKVTEKQLMLPNTAPTLTNAVPGNDLLSQTDNEMVFTRFIIIKRDPAGNVIQSRTDTIRYARVSDAAKVAYFDNYLKKYHP